MFCVSHNANYSSLPNHIQMCYYEHNNSTNGEMHNQIRVKKVDFCAPNDKNQLAQWQRLAEKRINISYS